MIARTPGQIRGLVIQVIADVFGQDPTEVAVMSEPGEFEDLLKDFGKFCYDSGFMDAIDKQAKDGGR